MTYGTLFVTGAQRSGTTLLEKLLGAQDGLSMLSQPFPLLFAEAKRQFLGGAEPYPLGHLFLESRYEPEAFKVFLREWRTTAEELETLFACMESYSGQYTRFAAERRRDAFAQITPGHDFADVVRVLDRALATKEAAWFGSKETICEEYVPFLLDRGFRCVIIVRDPRDLLASLNYGRGRTFGGELKPTLFNVRSWRKSVAFALAMDAYPRFARCRYEDLAMNPAAELSRVAAVLGLGTVTVSDEIHDADGGIWRGNSSHGEHRGVGTSSVGAHRDVLPREVAAFVEATCLPELQRLGYTTTMTRADAVRAIEAFVEPYTITRADMESNAMTPANARLEMERLERVTAAPDATSRRWFLFESAHAALRETFRP